MRKIVILLFLLLFTTAYSQTQQGIVKTRGRMVNGVLQPGKGLEGVTVQVKDRSALVSKAGGKFSFPLRSETYLLQSVKKNGYQLVDMEVCRKYKYSTDPLYLVMETPDQQRTDLLAAERKIRRNLQRQLQQKEDEIDALNASNEEKDSLLRILYQQQTDNEKLIADMAKRYSTIDYDQMDDFYRQVSYFIENGELTKADSLLRTRGDINKQVAEILERGQLIQAEETKLEKAKSVHQADIEEAALRCYSYYETFFVQHQNDSAAYYLELRANLDSLNVLWQLEAGSFIGQYLANTNKEDYYAKRALNNALRQYGECNMITARCYHRMATISTSIDVIMGYYKKAYDIGLQIEGEKTDFVAGIYNNIGDTYMTFGQYLKALEYLEKAYNIYYDIYGDENKWCANVMGIMGLIYNRMNQREKAIDLYKKALNIFVSTNDLDRKPFFLSSIYTKLSSVYVGIDNQKALEYLQKAYDIYCEIYPKYHPSIGHCNHLFGTIYYKLGDSRKAIDYLNKAIDCGSDVALSYNNIAFIYDNEGDYDSALCYYNNALQYVLSTLGDKHLDAALIYSNIAYILLKQEKFSEALEYYEKARKVYIETPGNFNNVITELGRYMYICYHKLLKEDKDKYSDRYKVYLQDIIFTATVISDDCASSKLGMEGVYYLFKFEDWAPDSLFDISYQIEKYKSKEKTIVVMKDNKLETIHFNSGLMGLGIVGEYVGKEEKNRIMDTYNKIKDQ